MTPANEARIKKIIAEQFGVVEDEVMAEKHLMQDLGGDSLDAIELAMALEDDFGIEIPDSDLETVKTVQDAINVVDKYVKD